MDWVGWNQAGFLDTTVFHFSQNRVSMPRHQDTAEAGVAADVLHGCVAPQGHVNMAAVARRGDVPDACVDVN